MQRPECPPPRDDKELARKLAATVCSHISGRRSMDYFLKHHTPANVADIWHRFAAHILKEIFKVTSQ